MSAYYNENDPKAAAWLRELIKAGHIAQGDVDERSIEDVVPNDLTKYTQCHFFAGIGGWSLALRTAGWPDHRPVWTGSCPCQPFSAAGKGGGIDDPRHLWPAWQWLIDQCRPPIVFGEQVASKAGREWFKSVQTDLQGMGYAAAAADICAAGVGAPHWRQRIWFTGIFDTESQRRRGRADDKNGGRRERTFTDRRAVDELEHGKSDGQYPRSQRHGGDVPGRGEPGRVSPKQGGPVGEASSVVGVGQSVSPARERKPRSVLGKETEVYIPRELDGSEYVGPPDAVTGVPQPEPFASALNSLWRDADWLYCTDGKWRPVEPGTFPLAHGVSDRVGLLRGYGNAIVPQVAATFIESVSENTSLWPINLNAT